MQTHTTASHGTSSHYVPTPKVIEDVGNEVPNFRKRLSDLLRPFRVGSNGNMILLPDTPANLFERSVVFCIASIEDVDTDVDDIKNAIRMEFGPLTGMQHDGEKRTLRVKVQRVALAQAQAQSLIETTQKLTQKLVTKVVDVVIRAASPAPERQMAVPPPPPRSAQHASAPDTPPVSQLGESVTKVVRENTPYPTPQRSAVVHDPYITTPVRGGTPQLPPRAAVSVASAARRRAGSVRPSVAREATPAPKEAATFPTPPPAAQRPVFRLLRRLMYVVLCALFFYVCCVVATAACTRNLDTIPLNVSTAPQNVSSVPCSYVTVLVPWFEKHLLSGVMVALMEYLL